MTKERRISELKEKYEKLMYIGDSVYIHFDGYHFILETINDDSGASNRIAIEPYVFDMLIMYRDTCYREFQTIPRLV